ncbi:MAG: DPP IV N-terminal domain-containing protein [Methanosarcinales archaeon]|nr:DPP IV N-terminal domain-containing protein [Methanosarcinales archaeon]
MNKKLVMVGIIAMSFILSAGYASAAVTVKNLEKLTDNQFMDTEPDWNPDDTKIIYMKYYPSDWWTHSAIYDMNVDGTDKRELAPVTSWHGKYSPDGTKIAYEKYYGTFIIKDLISGISEVLITSNWGYGGIRSSWSPDGKKIVYNRNNPEVGNYEIWVYDLEVRTNTKLTTENFGDGYGEIYPTWSPDGTKIAFMRQFDIWLMNPDGTEKIDITNTPYVTEDPYSWSPDSSMIAYTSFENLPNGERSSPNDICAINRDGTGMVKLTTDNLFHDNHPAWSHSGDKIVFDSNRAGNYDIWVMELSFDNEPPITSNLISNINPIPANTEVFLTALASDETTGGSTISSAEYNIDGGSFVGMSAQDGAFDEVTEDIRIDIGSFTEAGVHEICVRSTDSAENVGDLECVLLATYDSSAGFVTGGGWIDSPEEAYSPNPSLIGKANFGFVSKYKKGAEIPAGQTEFQFKVADLNFHSENYEWLVIAGSHAKYKGMGIINGAGNYGFMLTATDGDLNGGGVDAFRIKIWDKDNGDLVVYDNKPNVSDTEYDGTELGGGSIVIHKK